MSGFDEIMGMAGELAAKAAEKAKDLASAAAEQTKRVGHAAKLNVDISAQKEAMKKLYAELGKQYYENHRDVPETALAPLCRQIDTARQAIAALERELAALREETGDGDGPDAGDFASVVDETQEDAGVEVEITVEDPEEK